MARRAAGITAYLQNGGTIEHAQQIANHPLKRTCGESPRTAKLYDRTNDAIRLDERACPAPVPASGAGAAPGIERIMIQVGGSAWQASSNEREEQKPECPWKSRIRVAGRYSK